MRNLKSPELPVFEAPLNEIPLENDESAEHHGPLRAGHNALARPRVCLNAISAELAFLVSELRVLLQEKTGLADKLARLFGEHSCVSIAPVI